MRRVISGALLVYYTRLFQGLVFLFPRSSRERKTGIRRPISSTSQSAGREILVFEEIRDPYKEAALLHGILSYTVTSLRNREVAYREVHRSALVNFILPCNMFETLSCPARASRDYSQLEEFRVPTRWLCRLLCTSRNITKYRICRYRWCYQTIIHSDTLCNHFRSLPSRFQHWDISFYTRLDLFGEVA